MPELLVIFVIALLVIGPKRLPEMSRQMGKFFIMVKKATQDLRQALEQEPPDEITQEVRKKLGYPDEEDKDTGV